MSSLVLALQRDLRRSSERFASIQARLEGGVDRPVHAKNLLVASTLAAGFTFCLVPAAGCGGQTTTLGPGSLQDASALDAAEDSARPDAGQPSNDASSDRAPDAPETGPTCTLGEHDSQGAAALTAVDRDGCPPCTTSSAPFGIAIDPQGRVVDIRAQDGSSVPAEVRQCYLEALAGQTFPCLSGENVWQECVICLF
jgi:hypothetical protein